MQHDDRGFYSSIFRLSLPSAFQAMVSLLVVMADNVMVARLDSGFALAAVSQSNSLTNFVNAMLNGLAGGSVVLIAQYWGRRDGARIRQVFSMALAASLGVAALVVLGVSLFPASLMRLLVRHNEQRVIALALQYLPIVCFSYLPYAFSAAAVGFLKGIEVVKVTLYAAALSLFSNIGFNYLLIFGKLGFPAMGVAGAALATVLARLLEAAFIAYYCFARQQSLRVRVRDVLRQHAWAWRDYVAFGLPVAATDTQWALVGILKMAIIGQLGRVMMNAAAVSDMLMNLGTLFTFALAGGASVLVGKAVGSGDYARVRRYSNRIQRMFLLFGIVMAALVFMLRGPFIQLYHLDDDARLLAWRILAIAAPTLVGTTYHASCFVGINRGAGDSRFVMLVDMICGWLIVLPLSVLSAFVLHLPLHWVYFMTRIDQCFKWLIAYLRLRGDRWIHNVTRGQPVPPERPKKDVPANG